MNSFSPMNEPMLDGDAQEVAEERGGGQVFAWTLDHTEFYLDASDLRCDAGQMWLSVFVLSGVALGMIYEAMHLHAGPAKGVSSLVPFFGYCAQLLVALGWVVANRTWQGRWTRKMVASMVLSSMANGMAQALDYIALQQAGVMLFTIFHSSVTFFACLIAVLILRTRVTLVQWCACLAVVCGLVLSGVPSPVEAQGSFAIGIAAAAAGALCLAASYPLVSQQIIHPPRTLPPHRPPVASPHSHLGEGQHVREVEIGVRVREEPRLARWLQRGWRVSPIGGRRSWSSGSRPSRLPQVRPARLSARFSTSVRLVSGHLPTPSPGGTNLCCAQSRSRATRSAVRSWRPSTRRMHSWSVCTPLRSGRRCAHSARCRQPSRKALNKRSPSSWPTSSFAT